jgi:AcrR family transcriptional regulator
MKHSPLKPATVAMTARKTPQQARATVTRDAILQAAEQILEREGLASFNTNRVADIAGVSIGTLYQYYPNKTALVSALIHADHERVLSNLQTAIRQSRGKPLRNTIRKIIAVAVAHQFERPHLAAALDDVEATLQDDDALRLMRMMFGSHVRSALEPYRSEFAGDLDVIAGDLLCIVQALIDTAALRGETRIRQLQARVERAVIGYLLAPR